MDRQADHKKQNVAKWTFADAAGAIVGPLALGAAIEMGSGWRTLYTLTATQSTATLAIAARFPFPSGRAKAPGEGTEQGPARFVDGLRKAIAASKQGSVLRWLALLELANSMLDVLFGFVALTS